MANVLLHTQNININTICLVARKSVTYRNFKINHYLKSIAGNEGTQKVS